MNWPEVNELHDIIISPLLGESSKGNLSIGAAPPSPALRHFRYGSKESALQIVHYNGDDHAIDTIDEPIIYGGILFRHFGHLLTESIHRLWPRYAVKELHNARVAFNSVKNAKIVPYITEALNFHGFSKSQVILIDRPICFRRLFVGRQARTLAGPTTIENYRSMLDRDLSRRLSPPGPARDLYISRLRHQHTGSYYGETFVQEKLASYGFEVVYPEQQSLTDFVTILRSARRAIFAEGSAVHALELCGSHVPATAIISRRPVSVPRFSPLLGDICDRWLIADHLLTNAGMSDDRKKHSAVIDIAALMDDLCAFADVPAASFTSHEIMAAINWDVERHISQERDSSSEHLRRADQLRTLIRKTATRASGAWPRRHGNALPNVA